MCAIHTHPICIVFPEGPGCDVTELVVNTCCWPACLTRFTSVELGLLAWALM